MSYHAATTPWTACMMNEQDKLFNQLGLFTEHRMQSLKGNAAGTHAAFCASLNTKGICKIRPKHPFRFMTHEEMISTGPWQNHTRYQLALAFKNPPPPAQQPATPTPPPSIWMAPLTYKALYNSTGQAVGRTAQVRGSKQGQLCSIR